MTTVNLTTVRNTVEVVEGAVTTVHVTTAGPQGPPGPAGAPGPAGSTDLAWDAATRTVSSSTGTDAVITEATTSNAGLLSAADKSKINGIEAGAQVNVGVPTFIQSTQPTIGQLAGATKYAWWDTSGGNLTLWVEDGT